eukprot:15456898-Alexandrium_andersonii.AAC.1
MPSASAACGSGAAARRQATAPRAPPPPFLRNGFPVHWCGFRLLRPVALARLRGARRWRVALLGLES